MIWHVAVVSVSTMVLRAAHLGTNTLLHPASGLWWSHRADIGTSGDCRRTVGQALSIVYIALVDILDTLYVIRLSNMEKGHQYVSRQWQKHKTCSTEFWPAARWTRGKGRFRRKMRVCYSTNGTTRRDRLHGSQGG